MAGGLQERQKETAMINRLLTTTMLAGVLCACASTDENSQNPALRSEAYSTSMGPAGSYVEAPVPSMDSTRKVNEQDCRQPIDLKAGNLRCK
jgi:ABC-type uncharacterized transport system auxiliary subunit